jgi:acyl-CoA hydrolase
MKWMNLYQEKLRNAAEIAVYIQPNSVCVSPAMCGEPREILKAITDRARQEGPLGLEHHSLLTFHNHDFLNPDLSAAIKHVSWFTSGYSRKAVQEGRADYMPTYYKDVPNLWENYMDVDVFYALVSPMDQHGYFSFGLSCSESLTVKNKAKKIFLEVNPNMPRTHGQNFVHISEVEGLCESAYAIPELPEPPISDLDKRIGAYVAAEIPNGSTIQLGIGGIPNAVGRALMDKKDLGIHSEMFVEAFVDLIEAGAVTNLVKDINKGKSVTTFAGGSKRLYDFLNDNPSIEFRPVDYVNDPAVIGAHKNMMSINSCVEVDLLGQVCSESVGRMHYSGTGGQVDFVRGANSSIGGRAFIAMHSTAKRGTLSKIKPVLSHGSVVTTSKNDVDTIVTEYGIARLRGKTAGQRAKALIEIAHPDFRDELRAEAKKMNLMI